MRRRREIPIHVFELAYATVSYEPLAYTVFVATHCGGTTRSVTTRRSQHDRITTSWRRRRFIIYDYLIPDSTYNV